ncbi:MAG: hypothetical protein AAF307_03190 [Pseudomonadota bacterium]
MNKSQQPGCAEGGEKPRWAQIKIELHWRQKSFRLMPTLGERHFAAVLDNDFFQLAEPFWLFCDRFQFQSVFDNAFTSHNVQHRRAKRRAEFFQH